MAFEEQGIRGREKIPACFDFTVRRISTKGAPAVVVLRRLLREPGQLTREEPKILFVIPNRHAHYYSIRRRMGLVNELVDKDLTKHPEHDETAPNEEPPPLFQCGYPFVDASKLDIPFLVELVEGGVNVFG